jgi:hypothetical protein
MMLFALYLRTNSKNNLRSPSDNDEDDKEESKEPDYDKDKIS